MQKRNNVLLSHSFSEALVKNAALFAIGRYALKGLGMAATGASKAIYQGGKLFGRGMLPTAKSAPVGQKIFGGATKVVGLGALGYGGYKAHEAINKPRSSQNYTTHLRNNLLAGRIRPGQLSGSELRSVKTLGMN